MRNNNFLKNLLGLYPEANWDISKVMYGKYDQLKNINDGIYNFYSDKNICIPISLIQYQVNQPDFHSLLNNTNYNSITSVDWNFFKLIEHSNLNVDLFIKLILNEPNFTNFILNSDVSITLNYIFKKISQNKYLSLKLIEKYSIWDWGLLSSNLNLNEQFLKQHRNHLWDVSKLSQNPQFDICWIEIFPELPWRWDYISKNKNLKIEWVLLYSEKKWVLSSLTQSKYFNLSWLETLSKFENIYLNIHEVCWEKCSHFKIEWVSLISEYNWSFFKLSYHPRFEFRWIDEYPDEQWDWYYISFNKKITLDILKKYSHKYPSTHNLILNDSFDIDWVEKFSDWDWSFKYMSSLKNVSLDWLMSFPNSSWDYQKILLKSHLNKDLISFIISRGESKSWFFISRNKSFDINWVSSSNYKLCDWYNGISNQPTLTIEWIQKYPEAPWNINKIIENKNIVIEDFPILMKLFNLEISDFSLNPNLTLKYIDENREKLDFKKLSFNLFNGIYHRNYHQIHLKKKQLNIYGRELIEKTWHPDRFFNWCLDLESQEEIL